MSRSASRRAGSAATRSSVRSGSATLPSTSSRPCSAGASPGGLLGQNNDAAFTLFSEGRARSADYAYADLDYKVALTLPAGWRYLASVRLQAADRPLVDTEQIAVGAEGGARTYVYDDGSFDSGAVWRSELHAPVFAVLPPARGFGATLGPFAFADLAHVWDLDSGPSLTAASVGGGFDVSAGGRLGGRIAAGWSLTNAVVTHAGDFKLLAEARVAF